MIIIVTNSFVSELFRATSFVFVFSLFLLLTFRKLFTQIKIFKPIYSSMELNEFNNSMNSWELNILLKLTQIREVNECLYLEFCGVNEYQIVQCKLALTFSWQANKFIVNYSWKIHKLQSAWNVVFIRCVTSLQIVRKQIANCSD